MRMDWFSQLISNKILISGCVAWVAAQILKTIVHAIVNKKIDWPRLIGVGGMPSSHSATVTAVAATSALSFGLASFQFGVTVIVASIVMHDAMGVRKETGKHAAILNDMIDFFDSMGKDMSPEEKLKVFVGHSPLQVIAGAALGLAISLAIKF
ncbi:MAG TPA: divergent PAP2 family protein [Armatimonadota bacterium]|nr:divergent PAP2 family protein [Armatimonadota bacterium]